MYFPLKPIRFSKEGSYISKDKGSIAMVDVHSHAQPYVQLQYLCD